MATTKNTREWDKANAHSSPANAGVSGTGAQMKLSLEPDPHMRWIYDYTHPDYNSPRAKWTREARARAIASAPRWMIEEARLNDLARTLLARVEAK